MDNRPDNFLSPGDCELTIAKKLIDEIDVENTTDAEAGRRLLAARLASEAEARGIDPKRIPAELAEQWVASMRGQEATAVENIAVEKAIHLAANGSFERAGQILKDLLKREAGIHAAFDELRTGRRRQSSIAKKPRPNRKSTIKERVVAQMALARNRHEELSAFLFAAENGSISDLRIKRIEKDGKETFCIDVEDEIIERGFGTIQGWWTNAGE